jgi:hypothetical protein
LRRVRVVVVEAKLLHLRVPVASLRLLRFLQALGGGAHEIERLPKLPQKQLCLYRRVPVITSGA